MIINRNILTLKIILSLISLAFIGCGKAPKQPPLKKQPETKIDSKKLLALLKQESNPNWNLPGSPIKTHSDRLR